MGPALEGHRLLTKRFSLIYLSNTWEVLQRWMVRVLGEGGQNVNLGGVGFTDMGTVLVTKGLKILTKILRRILIYVQSVYIYLLRAWVPK